MRCKGQGCQCFDGDDCVQLPPAPCTDPESCGAFCFGMCHEAPVVAQCNLEDVEVCESCQ